MKIKQGFLLKNILDDYIVVPLGDNIVDFSVAVSLNETGAYLWQCLQNETDENALITALTAEYNVDTETAQTDVAEFLALLRQHQFLEDTQ